MRDLATPCGDGRFFGYTDGRATLATELETSFMLGDVGTGSRDGGIEWELRIAGKTASVKECWQCGVDDMVRGYSCSGAGERTNECGNRAEEGGRGGGGGGGGRNERRTNEPVKNFERYRQGFSPRPARFDDGEDRRLQTDGEDLTRSHAFDGRRLRARSLKVATATGTNRGHLTRNRSRAERNQK